MTLVTEALFLWVLANYIGMPQWAMAIVAVLFIVGRIGPASIQLPLGGSKTLRL